jgi:hypothetical protein
MVGFVFVGGFGVASGTTLMALGFKLALSMLLVIDWCSRLVSAIFGGLYCLRWPETSVVVVWFLLCVGLGGNCVVVICAGFVRCR